MYINKRDQTLYLPVSLCNVASLPKDFTKDARKMRDLHTYKISGPNERFERIQKLLGKLGDSDVFDEWSLKVNQNMTQVNAKKLYPAKVLDEKNNSVPFEAYSGGQIKHTQPLQMRKDRWAMIYSPYDFEITTNCYEMLQKAQGRFGIRVEEPQWVELKSGDDRLPKGEGYIKAI